MGKQLFIQQHRQFIDAFESNKALLSDFDSLRKELTALRNKAMENLDKTLFEFETQVRNGTGKIHWAPDAASCLETISTLADSQQNLSYIGSALMREIRRDGKVQGAWGFSQESPIQVVEGKFCIADTGQVFLGLADKQKWISIVNAKKVIILAGIDSLLLKQRDLELAHTLYALCEVGQLKFEVPVLLRPGKIRGINPDVSLILVDNGRSWLLSNPIARPLLHLLNFDPPPVSPYDSLVEANYEDKLITSDTLASFISDVIGGGLGPGKSVFNYGEPGVFNRFLPYDIDLSPIALECRHIVRMGEKGTKLKSKLGIDRSLLALSKNFNKPENFLKYARQFLIGK